MTGGAFAKLLRACGDVDGLERVRFTSPHPAEFTDDVIEAMAATPNVCPTCTCRCSPARTRVLKAMRRSYRAERYLDIVRPCPCGASRTRPSPPTSSSASPARPRTDFEATLDVVA